MSPHKTALVIIFVAVVGAFLMLIVYPFVCMMREEQRKRKGFDVLPSKDRKRVSKK